MDPHRRTFLTSLALLSAGNVMPSSLFSWSGKSDKLKVALVGTGIRGITFWGRRLRENYSDLLEFVGLSDINEGRLEFYCVSDLMKRISAES